MRQSGGNFRGMRLASGATGPFLTPFHLNVSRGGSAIYTGLSVVLYLASSREGRKHEVAPTAGHAFTALVAEVPVANALRQGDVIDLTGTGYEPLPCTWAKVINPRPYPGGVQCDVSRVPYQALTVWAAPSMTPGADGNVPDAVWSSSGAQSVYLEPMDEQARTMDFGNEDCRVARAFTVAGLKQNDVIRDSLGVYWIAQADSEFYPVTNDYVATVRHIVEPPQGVS